MMQRWTWKQPVIELLSTFLVVVNLFFFTPGVKAEKQVIVGAVSDLLVEGTSGFVHSLKPQEVNLP